MENHHSTRRLAIAIYTVNRHAKTAPNNKQLYALKKRALDKLLHSGCAKKIGLHFVDNPKFSKQHSTVLVRCGDFLFHTIPDKEDFTSLPHLGEQDRTARNPQERMSLKTARELLDDYVGEPTERPRRSQRVPSVKSTPMLQNTQRFRSSYLDGK